MRSEGSAPRLDEIELIGRLPIEPSGHDRQQQFAGNPRARNCLVLAGNPVDDFRFVDLHDAHPLAIDLVFQSGPCCGQSLVAKFGESLGVGDERLPLG
jgi:hypothetical protein